MNFAEKLISLRKGRSLSQEALADRIGVSRQSVTKWEASESIPELDKLILLSDLFAVRIDSLVRDDDECAIPCIPTPGESERQELIAFLCKAKKNTYAAAGAETTPSRPASHDLSFSEGAYYYHDTYLGGERFIGEEALWKNGQPVWAMNYSGRVLSDRFSGDFLKSALLRVPPEQPFRGPPHYSAGEYAYYAHIDGGFEWYSGHEDIFWSNEKTYECLFHGGLVR